LKEHSNSTRKKVSALPVAANSRQICDLWV
jgi:hypothetical protein